MNQSPFQPQYPQQQQYPQNQQQQAPYRIPAPSPTAEDEAQLNTLAICHFIYAGLLGVFGLIGIVYVILGVVVAAAAVSSAHHGTSGAPPAAIGGIFAVIGGAIMVLVWTKAALVLYSGLSLKKRKQKTFSIVVACLCCINIPLGAALGVFTLIVLNRPSVKGIYERAAYLGA